MQEHPRREWRFETVSTEGVDIQKEYPKGRVVFFWPHFVPDFDSEYNLIEYA